MHQNINSDDATQPVPATGNNTRNQIQNVSLDTFRSIAAVFNYTITKLTNKNVCEGKYVDSMSKISEFRTKSTFKLPSKYEKCKLVTVES